MIIDGHVHYGKDKDGKSTSVKNILHVLSVAGIDRALLIPFNEVDGGVNFEKANLRIAQIIERHRELLGGFRLSPKNKFESVVDSAIENGLKILKLHPRAQNFKLNSKAVYSVISYLENNYGNIPVIIHIDLIPQEDMGNITKISDIVKLAERFKNINFIAAHTGRPSTKTISRSRRLDNIYFDTSIAPKFIIEMLIEKVGSDRLIFGSDYPYSHPKVELEKIDLLDISKRSRNDIKGKNILRLLCN